MRKKNRHQHVWVETGRRFTAPTQQEFEFNFRGRGSAPSFVEDIIYGYTTISMYCATCNEPRTFRLQGEHIKAEPDVDS